MPVYFADTVNDERAYRVATFYTDAEGQRHSWTESFPIASSEFTEYSATARDLIENLLSDGPPDGPHPLGLEIINPTGQVVFTYVRPAPSEE